MIVVNCAMRQDTVKDLIAAIESPKFTFSKKEGIRLFYEVEGMDEQNGAELIKKTLKANPEMKALFFNVEVRK